MRSNTTGCCIVGGGPAGMMLGLLLARAGIETTVLEKHGDFLRDFRGDTIHPSTLQLMEELGWLEEFLVRPHQEVRTISAVVGDDVVPFADFTHLPAPRPFLVLMPQWDFLDFLADKAKAYPAFSLRMETQATGLLMQGRRTVGIAASDPDGEVEIRANLVVAADGRSSTLRDAAGLHPIDLGAPMDVLWMRLPKLPGDADMTLGRIEAGTMFVSLDRGDYWQCALIIAKGSDAAVRAAGLEAFRALLLRASRLSPAHVAIIDDWDKVKTLSVSVNRLADWARPGLLFIGDAAHAMSPAGGVGINLAIQDAVAAANLLTAPLRRGAPTVDELRKVQARRDFPTRVTQRMQVEVHRRVVEPTLKRTTRPKAPLLLKLFRLLPVLQRIPARLVGIGVRPEHIETPDRPA